MLFAITDDRVKVFRGLIYHGPKDRSCKRKIFSTNLVNIGVGWPDLGTLHPGAGLHQFVIYRASPARQAWWAGGFLDPTRFGPLFRADVPTASGRAGFSRVSRHIVRSLVSSAYDLNYHVLETTQCNLTT